MKNSTEFGSDLKVAGSVCGFVPNSKRELGVKIRMQIVIPKIQ